jgi:hypothetical protein
LDSKLPLVLVSFRPAVSADVAKREALRQKAVRLETAFLTGQWLSGNRASKVPSKHLPEDEESSDACGLAVPFFFPVGSAVVLTWPQAESCTLGAALRVLENRGASVAIIARPESPPLAILDALQLPGDASPLSIGVIRLPPAASLKLLVALGDLAHDREDGNEEYPFSAALAADPQVEQWWHELRMVASWGAKEWPLSVSAKRKALLALLATHGHDPTSAHPLGSLVGFPSKSHDDDRARVLHAAWSRLHPERLPVSQRSQKADAGFSTEL